MNKIKSLLCTLSMLLCALPSLAWGTLADCTNFTMTCPGGLLKVYISFTLPTKSADGTVDYTGQDMTWQFERNRKTVLLSGTAKAGATIDTCYTFPSDYSYYVDVRVKTSDGKQSVTEKTVYAGAGRPAKPTNVTLSIDDDGNASLSWDPITGTYGGGYVDYDSVYFDVTRYPDAEVVATNLQATSFKEKLEFSDYTMYYYVVMARFRTKESPTAQSNKVGYGRGASVPWLDDFTAESGKLWTSYDGDGDTRTWYVSSGTANSKGMYYDRDANNIFVAPPVYLEAGKVYDFSIKTRQYGSATGRKSQLNILLAQKPDTATLATGTQELLSLVVDNPLNFKVNETRFTVPESRNYYVVLQDVTPQEWGSYSLNCDSVLISDVGSQQAPDSVTGLTATPAARGAMSATLKFTAPTKALSGSTLSSLTKIDVMRADSVLVQSISAPEPGAALAVTDNSPECGFNTWTVMAYNDAGRGDTVHITAFVGIDQPLAVPNVHLQDQYDGTALLTWDAPDTVGVNGGYVNIDSLTYSVSTTVSDSTMLSGVTHRAIKVSELATTGDQDYIRFWVAATNSVGTGDRGYSNSIVVGAMETLPYYNSFNNSDVLSHFTYWHSWGVIGKTYSWGQVIGTSGDGDSCCVAWRPLTAGDETTLYTGKISLEGTTHPVVRYCYMEDAGCDQQAWFKIVRSSTDEIILDSLDYKTMTGNPRTWHRRAFDVTDLLKDQKYVQLAVRCLSNDTETDGMAFDGFEVFDALDYDLQAERISTTPAFVTGKTSPVTVTVTNLGYKSNARYSVLLLVNGDTVASQPGVAIPLCESREFTFSYTPLTISEDSCTVQCVIDYLYDSDESNNASTVLTVPVTRSPYTPVTTLTATGKGQVTLQWTKPTVDDVQPYTDNFEHYQPWQLSGFDKWRVIDGDGAETTAPTTYFYPHRGEPQAWMVQNDDQILALFSDSELYPHSGRQVVVSMSNKDKSANDDWLISPLLSGRKQAFKFWQKTSISSAPTIQVLVSSTDTLRESFTLLNTRTLSSNDWAEYTDTIPAGTKYVALRNVSEFKFYTYVDDVTYEPGCGDIVSYQIYEDGKLIATVTDPEATSYSFTPTTAVEHTYQLSVAYTEGVSSLSNKATAGGLPGDVNRDGRLNVSDVTTLVNMILGTVTPDATVGDIDGDGQLTTTDVTALINLIFDQE